MPTNQSAPIVPTAPRGADPVTGTRRPALLLAVAAGFCWAGAFVMLFSAGLEAEPDIFAPLRVIYYALILLAGGLTFIPAQRQLQLPGLALEGMLGSFLLLYALAFVPPPTSWLLSLPEMPVYIIFSMALFWSTSSIVMPLVHALGKRVFHQRARQYDLRRARRQSHEVGALIALCAALGGLRVLTPLGVALLVLIMVIVELLFLSFVETET